jgi:hypothetical protein
MEKPVVMAPATDAAVSEQFYRVIGQAPDTEAAWLDRQATLRRWRSDPRFEVYWTTIDHMLGDDFKAFRRRASALGAAGELEGYDFDAWRQQREYDLQHAHDHLP